jgi:hypothetical protein
VGMHAVTLARIQRVYDYLDANGPIYVLNVEEAAHKMNMDGRALTHVLAIVRSPWWIEAQGWTVPFVSKGLATKTYSVEHTAGQTIRLRNGNQRKSDEVETHLNRNLAGLQLEAKLASGRSQQKAQILAVATEAALKLIALLP